MRGGEKAASCQTKKEGANIQPLVYLAFFFVVGGSGFGTKIQGFFFEGRFIAAAIDKSLLLLESFQGELRVNNCRL